MKNKLIFLVVLGYTLSACDGYLEQLPDQRTTLDSPEKIAALLTSAYPQGNYIPFLESMTDNAEDKALASADLVNRASWTFDDVPDKGEDSPDFYWNACYAAIAAANHALEALEKGYGGEYHDGLKGEALVARAYAHFMLVTLFSRIYNPATSQADPGIPYVTETEDVVIKQYHRHTVQYVYDHIEEDLLAGIALLQTNTFLENRVQAYHFNALSAHAFASRFYLFKGEYARVVEHADAAFPGNSITSSLRVINAEPYRSLEPLAKLAEYTKATEPANLLLAETPSLWARNIRVLRYGFSESLLRRLVWGSNPTGGLLGYVYYGNEETLFTPKFREHFVKLDPNANIGIPYTIVPLLTAEEVLFNRAEAYLHLDQYEACLDDLNRFLAKRIIINDSNQPYYDPYLHTLTQKRVRDFYGSYDIKTGLLETILHFKRVEFIGEGLRWFDIIRLHLPVTHTSFDQESQYILTSGDPRKVLQLPAETMLSGLEQNPR